MAVKQMVKNIIVMTTQEGDNSGTSMSLLQYMPVREGYTFNGSNPKTGDNVMLYVAIASMSIIGLGATTIVAKKKKMN